MAVKRATVIGLMRGAFRRGQSASRFVADMKAKGLSYRRTDMLADWRSVNELERKAGAMRAVRRDYFPASKAIAEVEWEMSEEWMYKVKVQSRLSPGEPIQDRFVNILSDHPMTPAMVEQAVTEKWSEWEDYTAEAIEKIVVWTAVHKTIP